MDYPKKNSGPIVHRPVVHSTDVLWDELLPPGTLGQKEKLIALTKALELGACKKINIYMDSRYIPPRGYIPRERSAHIRGKRNKKQAGNLESLGCPDEASSCLINCPGHQKGRDSVARGNNQADQVTLEVALQEQELWASKRPLLGNRTGLKDGLT